VPWRFLPAAQSLVCRGYQGRSFACSEAWTSWCRCCEAASACGGGELLAVEGGSAVGQLPPPTALGLLAPACGAGRHPSSPAFLSESSVGQRGISAQTTQLLMHAPVCVSTLNYIGALCHLPTVSTSAGPLPAPASTHSGTCSSLNSGLSHSPDLLRTRRPCGAALLIEPGCTMAGLGKDPVQVYRTLRVKHWEFLRRWTGFELSSS
jgi:hypothetical protein